MNNQIVPQEEPPRLLVADDDAVMRVMAREVFQQAGWHVETVEDGQLALSSFDDMDPDIVLLDVQMPNLDGFQTCAKLRRLERGAHIPVFMITGRDDLEAINRAYEVGATDFVTKPVNWVILKQRIRHMLRAKRAAEAQREAEARNQALLDAVPDLMFRIAEDGTLLDYKPPAQGMHTFVSPEEFVGEKISQVMPEELAETFLKHVRQTLASGQIQTFDYRLGGDGEPRDYEARTVVSGSQEVLGIVCDITEHNRLEAQLRRSQKMEALGLLAGGVAHDFNNALSVITLQVQRLQNRLKGQEDLSSFANSILAAATHSSKLTSQLLAFGRKQLMEPRLLDLNGVAKDLLKMLDRVMAEDVEVETDLAPDLWQIKVDPGRIEQVIMNLAVNAREAMPRGGKFTIQTRNCPLQEGPEGAPRVMLAVSDTGHGMDEGTLERVFEPFYTTKGSGTGLGLSTVHGIVSQSGGEIRVDSVLGKGTTFEIYFARAEGQEEAVATEAEDDEWALGGSETILVAEDDQSIRDSLCDLLQDKGYKVLSAANGREGINLSRDYEGSIDLLITDVVMPEMGGTELAEALFQQRPETKILYMTGHPGNVTLQHGLDSQATFLQKPLEMEVLSRKLHSLLRHP